MKRRISEVEACVRRIEGIVQVHRLNPGKPCPCGMHRRWEDCLIMECERLTDARAAERHTARAAKGASHGE